MTSGYHCSKISGLQQAFLTETVICFVERWKKSMGCRFVPECDHAQESQTCQPFRYFLSYLQDHGLLRPRNHGNQGNVIQLLLLSMLFIQSRSRLVPSRYLSVLGGERRLGIRLRRVQGLMGYFSFFPSHETLRAPQPNPQSSLNPKNT